MHQNDGTSPQNQAAPFYDQAMYPNYYDFYTDYIYDYGKKEPGHPAAVTKKAEEVLGRWTRDSDL